MSARPLTGFLVVVAPAIACGHGAPTSVAKFHESVGLQAPITIADGWIDDAGINSYPTHLFVDREVRVAFQMTSDPDMAFTFPARIDALLGDRP